MSDTYYLRWKSQVTGPYQDEDIRTMLEEARITKHHQVSTDQTTWISLIESEAFRNNCRVTLAPNVIQGAAQVISATPVRNPDWESNTGRLRVKTAEDIADESMWYYVDGSSSAGPVSGAELQRLADEGVIAGQSPICREGEERWVKAITVFPSYWSDQPRSVDRSGQGSLAESSDFRYAGFWIRFCALFIDSIIVGIFAVITEFVVCFALGLSLGAAGANIASITSKAALLAMAVGATVNWLYYAAGESSMAQATLGKRAMGIIVTDMNGKRITFGHATGRYIGKFISSILLCVGYLMVAFTEKKQGLHDIMAGTLVLRK